MGRTTTLDSQRERPVPQAPLVLGSMLTDPRTGEGAASLMVADRNGLATLPLHAMRKTPKPLPAIHLRSRDQKMKRQWDAALEDGLAVLGEPDFLEVQPPSVRDHGGLSSMNALWQQRFAAAAAHWADVNDAGRPHRRLDQHRRRSL